jgi:hypothetical protein
VDEGAAGAEHLEGYPRQGLGDTVHARRLHQAGWAREEEAVSEPKPQFHPIGALPAIAAHVEGWLGEVLEMHQMLGAARASSLDDATVVRTIRIYTEAQDDLALFEEQLRRWRHSPTSLAQRDQVNDLTMQLARIGTGIASVLMAARRLRAQTIETVLRKTHTEDALELVGKPAKKDDPS